jgi:hypothetical protein
MRDDNVCHRDGDCTISYSKLFAVCRICTTYTSSQEIGTETTGGSGLTVLVISYMVDVSVLDCGCTVLQLDSAQRC